jgi:hypothetical protein
MHVGLMNCMRQKTVGEGVARAWRGSDGSLFRLRAQTPGLTALRRA